MPTFYYALLVIQIPSGGYLNFMKHNRTGANTVVKVSGGASVEIVTDNKESLKDAVIEHILDSMQVGVLTAVKEQVIITTWGEIDLPKEYFNVEVWKAKRSFMYVGFKPKNFIVLVHRPLERAASLGFAFKDFIVKAIDETLKRMQAKGIPEGFS